MLISGYGAGTSLAPQLRSIQDRMGDLQRQLSTGKVARDFAGLGAGRDVSLTMRAQLSKTSSYANTISFVSGRLEATQLVLGRVEGILNDTAKGTLEANIQLTSEGKTVQQMLAEKRFEETLALLDTEYEGRHLFGGRRMEGATNVGASAIMNGKGGRDGLLEIINERQAADVAGADGATGRVAVAGAGTAASLTDEANPFGVKLVPGSELTNLPASASKTSAAGTPNTVGFDLGATNPAPGQWVSFDVALPDGTRHTVRLEARAPGASDTVVAGDSLAPADLPNEVTGFAIGATSADTADNLRQAMRAALTEVARERLPNASAMQAAEDFFAYDDAQSTTHPKRVNAAQDGFEPVADAKAKTVLWYTGETGGGRARSSAVAKIDDSLEVSYGARANEDLFKGALAALAVFASEDFPVDDHANRSRYMDMADRVRGAVSGAETEQRTRAMQADFASVQVAVDEARQRHRFRDVLAEDMIAEVENTDDNLVATQLLALQTQLQMSFQTTAMISRMSLANVL